MQRQIFLDKLNFKICFTILLYQEVVLQEFKQHFLFEATYSYCFLFTFLVETDREVQTAKPKRYFQKKFVSGVSFILLKICR